MRKYLAPLLTTAAVVVGFTACSSTATPVATTGTTTAATSVPATEDAPPVSTESDNAQFPPPADVTVTGCAADETGTFTITGTILNHSPKTSDYDVQGTLADSAGAHVGDWSDTENNVAAGQTARFSTYGLASNPQGAVTCQVVSVDRTASSG